MTRKSKREVERTLERLECRQQTNTDVALMIAPDFSFPDMNLPDVSMTGIRATSSETGAEEIVVPYHRPDAWWCGKNSYRSRVVRRGRLAQYDAGTARLRTVPA